jgi:hypothetical protein
MLMSPPPGGYSTPSLGPSAQSMQLLGSPQSTQNPQMMRYLMGLSGQGGFGGHSMAGPSLGPVQQGPLGAAPPRPNQGGF